MNWSYKRGHYAEKFNYPPETFRADDFLVFELAPNGVAAKSEEIDVWVFGSKALRKVSSL